MGVKQVPLDAAGTALDLTFWTTDRFPDAVVWLHTNVTFGGHPDGVNKFEDLLSCYRNIMSSSRLSYDPSAYQSEVTQSTNPLMYSTDPVYTGNCDKCFPEVGASYPSNYRLTGENRLDIENTLSQRKRKLDKHQMNGEAWDDFQELAIKYEKDEVLTDCPTGSESQYSLLSDPRSNYRGLRTDQIVFSTVDSYIQDGTHVPMLRNPGAVSSRDVAIDQYRKIVDSKKICNKPDCAPSWPAGYQA